jgi:amidohydrolase
MVQLEDLKAYEEYVIKKREDFHMHPETGFKEFRTAKIIEKELKTMGYNLVTKIAKTGIVATLDTHRPGKTILLRSDIDALQMQEENDVPYKSIYDGFMHACGHDAHIAMLLGAAKYFSEHTEKFKGKIKLVFQPAEEGPMPGGGLHIVNEGHIDDADAVFGIHITTSYEEGIVHIKKGEAMAAPDEFSVEINGIGTHASAPESGNDVILTAANMIQNIQTIISRNISPTDSAVISVSTIHGGTAFNILPDKVTFGGTIRTLNETVRKYIFERLNEVVKTTAELHNVSAKLLITEAYPPLINDPVQTDFVIDTVKASLGEDNVFIDDKPTMGGEDFAYYLQKKPGTFFWLGGRKKGQDEIYYNHNSKFDVASSSLLYGTMLHINLANAFLNEK